MEKHSYYILRKSFLLIVLTLLTLLMLLMPMSALSALSTTVAHAAHAPRYLFGDEHPEHLVLSHPLLVPSWT